MEDEDLIARKDRMAAQRRMAWLLSLAGFVPFGLAALLVVILGTSNALADPLVAIFRNYSAIILSFLGGIRWGHALLRETDERSAIEINTLLVSVLPALVAWGTMFLDTPLALSILLLAYCAQGAWDSFSTHSDVLPRWFGPVRMTLTGLVALAHIAVILATI